MLDAALAATDLPVIKSTAHRIRGTAASYGYPTVSTLAAELEAASTEGVHTPEEAKPVVAALIEGIRKALEQTRQQPTTGLPDER